MLITAMPPNYLLRLTVILLACLYINLVYGKCNGDDCSSESNEELAETKKKPSLLDGNKQSPGKAILTALFPFLPFDQTTVKPFETKKHRKPDKRTKADHDSDEDTTKVKKRRKSKKKPADVVEQKISTEASSTNPPETTTPSYSPIGPMSRSRGDPFDVLVQKEISSSRMSDLSPASSMSRPSIANPLNSEESLFKENRRGRLPLGNSGGSENERGKGQDEERNRYDHKQTIYSDGDTKTNAKKSKKSKVSRYTQRNLEDAYMMTQVSQKMADVTDRPNEKQHNELPINRTKDIEMDSSKGLDASKPEKSHKMGPSNLETKIDSDYKTKDRTPEKPRERDGVERNHLDEFDTIENSKTKIKEKKVNMKSQSQYSDELDDRPRRKNNHDDNKEWAPEKKSSSRRLNGNVEEGESEDEVEIRKKKKKKKGSRRSQSVGVNYKLEKLERNPKSRKKLRGFDYDTRELQSEDESNEFPHEMRKDEKNTKRRLGIPANRKYESKKRSRVKEDRVPETEEEESKTLKENEKKPNIRRFYPKYMESEETAKLDHRTGSFAKGQDNFDSKESIDFGERNPEANIGKIAKFKATQANEPQRALGPPSIEEKANFNLQKDNLQAVHHDEENEFNRESSNGRVQQKDFDERVSGKTQGQHEDFDRVDGKREGKNKSDKTKFAFQEKDRDASKEFRSGATRKNEKLTDSFEQNKPQAEKADPSEKPIKNSFRRADLEPTRAPLKKPTLGVDSFLTRKVSKNNKRKKPKQTKDMTHDEGLASTSFENLNKDSESDETVRKNGMPQVQENFISQKREADTYGSSEAPRRVKSDMGENRVMTGKKSKKKSKPNKSAEALDVDVETKSKRKKSKAESDDSVSPSNKKKHVTKNRKSKQSRNNISREEDVGEKPNRSKKERKSKKRIEKEDESFEDEKRPKSRRNPEGSMEEEKSSRSKRIQEDSLEYDRKSKSKRKQDMSFEEERASKTKQTDIASLEDDVKVRSNKMRDGSIEEEKLTTVNKKKQRKGFNRGGFIDSFESYRQRKKEKSRKEDVQNSDEYIQTSGKHSKLKLAGKPKTGKGSKRLRSNLVYDDIDDRLTPQDQRTPHGNFQPLTYDNSLDSVSSSNEQVPNMKGNINHPRRAPKATEQHKVAQQRTIPISARVAYPELSPEKRLRVWPDGVIEANPGINIPPKSPLSPRHASPSETAPSTFQDDFRQTAKNATQSLGGKAISLGSMDSKLERSVKAADPGLVSKQDSEAKSALGQLAIMSPLRVSSVDTHGQGIVITDKSNSSSEEAEEIYAPPIQTVPGSTAKPKKKKPSLKEGGVISNAVGSFLSILTGPSTPRPSR